MDQECRSGSESRHPDGRQMLENISEQHVHFGWSSLYKYTTSVLHHIALKLHWIITVEQKENTTQSRTETTTLVYSMLISMHHQETHCTV